MIDLADMIHKERRDVYNAMEELDNLQQELYDSKYISAKRLKLLGECRVWMLEIAERYECPSYEIFGKLEEELGDEDSAGGIDEMGG